MRSGSKINTIRLYKIRLYNVHAVRPYHVMSTDRESSLDFTDLSFFFNYIIIFSQAYNM